MTGLQLDHTVGRSIRVRDGDTELFEYTYQPDTPLLESPKPYLHPMRTRRGNLVSLFRPHDHVWHKGVAWSLPVVGDENFWGGPTYVHGQFYVQLDNNGTQQNVAVDRADVEEDRVVFAHVLEWNTQAGDRMFTERRELAVRVVDEASWMLEVTIEMTNVSSEVVSIGSPTTKGRENAGYGGLFWRGPRSFTGGSLIASSGAGGDELRGSRNEWMAFAGRHDVSDEDSLVLMVDHRDNPHHPPQWFARSEEFACLNPAPFFSEELDVAPGETIEFRYGIGIADGNAADAAALAEAVRTRLAPTLAVPGTVS